MALCGHPFLFFVLCLSICPRPSPGQATAISSTQHLRPWPGGSHFQQSWQLFRIDRGRPSLQNPRFQAFRAQNSHFCALFAFGTPIFRPFEHKIGIFVRFCPSEPSFSGISSTKSRFLCAFALRNPRFQAFRAQNRGFCALLDFGTLDFRLFEHKIAIFVLGKKGIGIGKNKYGLPANHRAHL